MNTPFSPQVRTDAERSLDRCVRAMGMAERAEMMVDALEILERGASERLSRLNDAVAAGDIDKMDAMLSAAEAWEAYYGDLLRYHRRLARAQRHEAACRRAFERIKADEPDWAFVKKTGLRPDQETIRQARRIILGQTA